MSSDRSDRRRIRGTAESVIEARKKLSRSSSGQADAALPPSQEAIREAIAAGICPWCKRGPFKMLAGHVNTRHGIDRFELRELAGLVRHAMICDPDYSRERAEQARGLGLKPPPVKQGRTVTLSSAGREQLRENGRTTGQATPADVRSAMGKKGGRTRGDQLRKERQPCAVCGGAIAFSPGYTGRKTCSAECLTKAKAENMRRIRRATA